MTLANGSLLTAFLVAGAALSATACGAADGECCPTDGGPHPLCTMSIGVSPTAPTAPATVELEGGIVLEGDLSGTRAYTFSVTFESAVVETTELDPYDGSRVSFYAASPGPYRVELRGTVGATECTDGLELVNVSDPGAQQETVRFRFAPAAGQPAPVQERLFAIPGGADYSLGTVGLESGVEVSGQLRDEASDPLAAYLRVALTGGALHATEIFANDEGAFSARLAAGSYDVLVVPKSAAVAPDVRTGLGVSSFGLITLTAGDAITGVVLGPTGAPLAGARVSLRIDDVPSAIATTDAAGSFSVLGRAGGATAVTVNPPAGSGLPRLELDADAGLVVTSGTPLTVAYSPALASRDVSFDVVASDGSTAAPGARVTFIARSLSDAGSLTPEAGAALAMRGELRMTAEASTGGALPSLSLPEGVYDAVVEPPVELPGEAAHIAAVDLSAGDTPPATLALAPPATLTGKVVDSAASGIGGVLVTAIPRGLLANVAGASATATTNPQGAFEIDLVGGGEYDLVLEPRGATLARVRASEIVAPAAGVSDALDTISLPKAIAVSGRVEIPGVAGGAAGVHVMALCYDCTGVMAATPIADAVSGTGGSFVLAIPDPGVGE